MDGIGVPHTVSRILVGWVTRQDEEQFQHFSEKLEIWEGKRRDLLFARLTFDITIRRQLFSIKGKQTIYGRTINSVYKCTLLELDVVLTGRHYNLTKLQLVAVTTGRRYNWTPLQLDTVMGAVMDPVIHRANFFGPQIFLPTTFTPYIFTTEFF